MSRNSGGGCLALRRSPHRTCRKWIHTMAMWARSLRARNGGGIYSTHRLEPRCFAARLNRAVPRPSVLIAGPEWFRPVWKTLSRSPGGGDCAAEQYSAGSVPLLAFAILVWMPRGIGRGRGGALYQVSDVLRAPNGRARAEPVGRRVSPTLHARPPRGSGDWHYRGMGGSAFRSPRICESRRNPISGIGLTWIAPNSCCSVATVRSFRCWE